MILAETIYVFKGIILRLERSRVSIRQAIVQIDKVLQMTES